MTLWGPLAVGLCAHGGILLLLLGRGGAAVSLDALERVGGNFHGALPHRGGCSGHMKCQLWCFCPFGGRWGVMFRLDIREYLFSQRVGSHWHKEVVGSPSVEVFKVGRDVHAALLSSWSSLCVQSWLGLAHALLSTLTFHHYKQRVNLAGTEFLFPAGPRGRSQQSLCSRGRTAVSLAGVALLERLWFY